jgi:hypothetical protein
LRAAVLDTSPQAITMERHDEERLNTYRVARPSAVLSTERLAFSRVKNGSAVITIEKLPFCR